VVESPPLLWAASSPESVQRLSTGADVLTGALRVPKHPLDPRPPRPRGGRKPEAHAGKPTPAPGAAEHTLPRQFELTRLDRRPTIDRGRAWWGNRNLPQQAGGGRDQEKHPNGKPKGHSPALDLPAEDRSRPGSQSPPSEARRPKSSWCAGSMPWHGLPKRPGPEQARSQRVLYRVLSNRGSCAHTETSVRVPLSELGHPSEHERRGIGSVGLRRSTYSLFTNTRPALAPGVFPRPP